MDELKAFDAGRSEEEYAGYRQAELVKIKAEDVENLARFAREKEVDLTVVGPEVPLALGIVDRFNQDKLKIVGPTRKAAQLEADKAFAKHIMRANSIPTAESRTFTSFEDAKAYIASRDEAVVVKAAGLAKGSGVPNRDKVGKVTRAQVKEIAELKMPDLNTIEVETAMRSIEGRFPAGATVLVAGHDTWHGAYLWRNGLAFAARREGLR